jgi:hypothetical protein
MATWEAAALPLGYTRWREKIIAMRHEAVKAKPLNSQRLKSIAGAMSAMLLSL